MAIERKDRVKDTTTTTGTGTITLSGSAPLGYRSVSAAHTDGATVRYAIALGGDWEVGEGIYTASGNTLSRDTVLASSNSGSLVNFPSGTKIVLTGLTANEVISKDVANNWTSPQRSALLTDNDGSFDLSAKQNFKCTPTAGITLTFTNQADGLSGSVLLVNGSNYTVSAHANTKINSADLSVLSTTGTYRIDYLSDGTNAYCTISRNLA